MIESLTNPITIEQEFTKITATSRLENLKNGSNNVVSFTRKVESINLEDTIKAASEASKSSFSGNVSELRKQVESTDEVNVPKVKMGYFLNNTSIETVQKQLDTLENKAKTAKLSELEEIMVTASKEYIAEQPSNSKEKEDKKGFFDNALKKVRSVFVNSNN